jgi:hypothetical protein
MTRMDEGGGDGIWINAEEMLKTRGSLVCHGMVMDLLMVIWAPTKEAFRFEPKALAERLNAIFPRREYSADLLLKHEHELLEFFVVLPDGRWAPNPKYFVLNDPGSETLN